MSKLANFFQGADTQFGIFYPKSYVVAIFPTWEEAENAHTKLKHATFSDRETIAVTGQDVVELAEESLKKSGLWALLIAQVSRAIDTEVPLHDQDLELARKGAAFVAVYCPTDARKATAWKVLDPLNPMIARYYGAGGVEHLADTGAHAVPQSPVPTVQLNPPSTPAPL